MQVKLIAWTQGNNISPEQLVGLAGRLCYTSKEAEKLLEDFDLTAAVDMVNKLSTMNHETPLEFAVWIFLVSGISRACSHELVRHRIASYNQRSQRYVDENNFKYVIPPTIEAKPEAKIIYEQFMLEASKVYQQLKSLGIPKEDTRFVLPNATQTQMMVGFNTRSFKNFIRLRTCNRAQWEIRKLAGMMLKEVKKVSPSIVRSFGPPCQMDGYCPEGNMQCLEKKDKIPTLKQLLQAWKSTTSGTRPGA